MRPGREGIIDSARQEFAEHGYGGASVRDIARRAGVSMAALYHWFPSKQHLLGAMLAEDLEHYSRACEEALTACGETASERLAALVEATVRYRVAQPVRSRVVASEGRNLAPEQRASYQQAVERAGQRFRLVIDQGLAAGEFRTPYPDEARRMILASCNAIPQWYQPSGKLGVEDLVVRYSALALTVAGATSAR